MMSDTYRFWIVWNESHGFPTKRHESQESAEKEAARIAEKHPGARVFVMDAYCHYSVEPMPMAKKTMLNWMPAKVDQPTRYNFVDGIGGEK